MLTVEHLRAVLDYDPDTGVFRWRQPAGRHGRYAVGTIAGWVDISTGYRFIQIGPQRYRAHRLAWLHFHSKWPSEDLDHRDLDPANNAIANLRETTDFGNTKNRRRPKHNTTGFKGVAYRKRSALAGYPPYEAKIMVNKKSYYLGSFSTPEEAYEAYCRAAVRLHGEFVRLE